MIRKIIFLFTVIYVFSTNCFAQSTDEIAIRKVMAKQSTAWSAGKIETFMEGYWKSDSLMFIGKSGITYGWDQTLKNYKKAYPDTTAMGQLTFTIISVKRLSADYYFLTGKFHLKRTIGDLEGYYTLLFRKINGEWKIVADHTS